MREFVEQLLKVKPEQLAAAVCHNQLPIVLAKLSAFTEALEHQVLSNSRVALTQWPAALSETSVWALSSGADSGELARHCLSFSNADGLARARLLSRSWCAWADADALWRPLTQGRWGGTAALCSAGIVQGRFADLYFRRCWLERNKASLRVLPPLPDDVKKYSVLVEMSHEARPALQGLFALTASADCSGLQAQFPPGSIPMSIMDSKLDLSLTVVRHLDGKLMRICKDAELELPQIEPNYLTFDIGGDAGDALMHPALWSVLRDEVCHHVGLDPANSSFYIGLWNPRTMISHEGAARLLTVWEEVAEWA